MAVLGSLLFATLTLTAQALAVIETSPCCQGACKVPGEEKYWSLAKSWFGTKHCGECCMDPKKYPLYHFFEKNLTKSMTDNPCSEFGYTKYDSTDTHGAGPIKMTLDLYDLPAEATVTCNEVCKDTCCRDGGGDACVSACGCTGSCPAVKAPAVKQPFDCCGDKTFGPIDCGCQLGSDQCVNGKAPCQMGVKAPAVEQPLDCCGDKTFGPIDCSCQLGSDQCVNGKAPCQ